MGRQRSANTTSTKPSRPGNAHLNVNPPLPPHPHRHPHSHPHSQSYVHTPNHLPPCPPSTHGIFTPTPSHPAPRPHPHTATLTLPDSSEDPRRSPGRRNLQFFVGSLHHHAQHHLQPEQRSDSADALRLSKGGSRLRRVAYRVRHHLEGVTGGRGEELL